MKKFGLKPFLIKYGGYVEPGQFFYHRRLQERLAALGLRAISIRRYPVWEIRARAPLDAQARLLLGKSYKGHRPACWASDKADRGPCQRGDSVDFKTAQPEREGRGNQRGAAWRLFSVRFRLACRPTRNLATTTTTAAPAAGVHRHAALDSQAA